MKKQEKRKEETTYPDPLRFTWLIYGEPKIGKTTLASLMEEPYFLPIDPGHKFVDIQGDQITGWEDILQKTEGLCSSNYYKTVVIDTAQDYYELCFDFVCRKECVEHIGEIPHRRGWDLLSTNLRRPVTSFVRHGLGVVFIAHEVEKESQYQGRTKNRIVPNIHKRGWELIHRLSDIILYMRIQGVEEEGQFVMRRAVTASPHPDRITGDRSGLLEPCGDIILWPKEDGWKIIKDNMMSKQKNNKEDKNEKNEKGEQNER